MSLDILYEMPVKKYVKRFLELEYGNPAWLTQDTDIGKFFHQLVSDKNNEFGKRIGNSSDKKYDCTIIIRFAQPTFTQKGHLVTPTNVVKFNAFVEYRIKENWKFYFMGAISSGNYRRKKAYDDFMELTGMTYEDLPMETLRKFLQRSGVFKNTRLRA